MRMFGSGPPKGSTFSDLEIDPPLDPAEPAESIASLRAAVEKYKNQRVDWYRGQMRRRSALVNGLPGIAALLAVVGILFTSGAAVVRTLSLAQVVDWTAGDLVMTGVAVVAYTLMSAALLYERLTEGSGGYFRAAAAVAAIRDLWSAYQFADIARSLAPAKDDPKEEIERWRAPAADFCKALDAIVADEMIAWKTAYQAAAKQRGDIAEAGLAAAVGEMKAAAETAVNAAKEASKKAEEAAKKAEEAAKAAADAQAPATLNLSLGTATTAGTAVVKLDGKQVASGINQRSFSITPLKQGEHHIRVEFTPSAAGSSMTPFEKSVRLGGGISDLTIEVP